MKDTDNLRSQGFKNATQVLAVILNESITNIKEDENRIREIESTKADTSLLALDDGYMQVYKYNIKIKCRTRKKV